MCSLTLEKNDCHWLTAIISVLVPYALNIEACCKQVTMINIESGKDLTNLGMRKQKNNFFFAQSSSTV